ncbi:MAG: glycosyltransferase family 4 protein, partial [Acidobacteriota bacterium]
MGGGTDGVEIRRPAILHLHTEPAWGGGENQVLQLLKGLTQSGYGVSLVALPESPLATRCRQEGLDCRPVEMASDLDLLGAARIARLARQGGFHILHAHTARAHALGLLARYMGAPCRLVVSRRLSVPISGHLLGRLKYRSRRVDLYLAVARTVQSILMEAGIQAQRIQVVHSCIDLTPFD